MGKLWDEMTAENLQAGVDARLAHERMLSAARQARYKARKRAASGLPAVEAPGKKVTRESRGNGKGNGNGGNGKGALLDSNGKPSARIERVAQSILAGATDSTALVEAGFKHNSTEIANLARNQLAVKAQEHGVTVDRWLGNIVRRDKASKPVYTEAGCIDAPDHTAQAGSARDQERVLDRLQELPAAQGNAGHGVPNMQVQIILYDGKSLGAAHQSEAIETTFTSPIPQEQEIRELTDSGQ